MENIEAATAAAVSEVRQASGKNVTRTLEQELTYPVAINIKTLLAAGAHYGHQTQRWNPKMLPFIYCAKNKVHIINLDITMQQWKRARQFIVDTVGRGGEVLFVGTKPAARDMVKQEAERCGAFYVNTRWLGGTLSNFQTVKNSIDRMRQIEDLLAKASVEGSDIKLNKKEKLQLSREIEKLQKSLGGIRNMKKLPDVVFAVDIIKEDIAIAECQRLQIPVVALVDTNTDPELIDYPIASNDDAAKTLRLMLAGVSDAIMEGKVVWETRKPKEHASREAQHKEKKAEEAAA